MEWFLNLWFIKKTTSKKFTTLLIIFYISAQWTFFFFLQKKKTVPVWFKLKQNKKQQQLLSTACNIVTTRIGATASLGRDSCNLCCLPLSPLGPDQTQGCEKLLKDYGLSVSHCFQCAGTLSFGNLTEMLSTVDVILIYLHSLMISNFPRATQTKDCP